MDFVWETLELQNVEDELPFYGVGSFFHVKLEEEGGSLAFVKAKSKIPHIHIVIMDTSLLNECTLGVGDMDIHTGVSHKARTFPII